MNKKKPKKLVLFDLDGTLANSLDVGLDTMNKIRFLFGYKKLDPDQFDPFWIQTAGVEAARLCESQEEWGKAINVYNRVLAVVPSLRSSLQKKIASASAHVEAAKK